MDIRSHSAARGKMGPRGLVVFKHASALGNAPAQRLFDLVKVARANGSDAPPRSFADYEVALDKSGLPGGVEAEVLL